MYSDLFRFCLRLSAQFMPLSAESLPAARGIPDVSDLAPHRSKLDQLLEGRDMLYDNLRDLKFDFRAGKYSEADYESIKTALESQAAIVLTRIDEVTEAQIRRPRVVRASMGEPAAASGRSGK